MQRRFTERPQASLRRFVPSLGHQLTVDSIRGPWRPSGAVAGAGVFAVVWTTRKGDFWAPLHDFSPTDQLRLIEACRVMDQGTSRPICFPEWLSS